MTAKDKIAALATVEGRLAFAAEKMSRVRGCPVELLAELRSVQRAVEAVRVDIEEEAARPG